MTANQVPLICTPIDRMAVLESPQRPCSECSGLAWVSPAMVDKVDNGTMRVVCVPCATPLMTSGVRMEIHKDQVGDLYDAGLLGYAAHFADTLNQKPETWLDYERGSQRLADDQKRDSGQRPEYRGNRAHRRTRRRGQK